MKLWLSAEVQADVGDALWQARKAIEPTVNAKLSSDYGSSVETWAVISVVRPRVPVGWGESRRYNRRRKVVEFFLIIDHATFKQASEKAHVTLLFNSILRSIGLARFLDIGDFDRERFEADVRAIGLAEGWLPGAP